MKNNIQPNTYVYILGAHPNLPVNKIFKLENYEGLSAYWGFK